MSVSPSLDKLATELPSIPDKYANELGSKSSTEEAGGPVNVLHISAVSDELSGGIDSMEKAIVGQKDKLKKRGFRTVNTLLLVSQKELPYYTFLYKKEFSEDPLRRNMRPTFHLSIEMIPEPVLPTEGEVSLAPSSPLFRPAFYQLILRPIRGSSLPVRKSTRAGKSDEATNIEEELSEENTGPCQKETSPCLPFKSSRFHIHDGYHSKRYFSSNECVRMLVWYHLSLSLPYVWRRTDRLMNTIQERESFSWHGAWFPAEGLRLNVLRLFDWMGAEM